MQTSKCVYPKVPGKEGHAWFMLLHACNTQSTKLICLHNIVHQLHNVIACALHAAGKMIDSLSVSHNQLYASFRSMNKLQAYDMT